MTAGPTIDMIEVVDRRDRVGRGDDGLFVAMHGEGRTGWYGPIGDEPARYVGSMLDLVAIGLPIFDHDGLQVALRREARPLPARPASWAIGAIDCAAWDLHGKLVGTSVTGLLNASPASEIPLYASWLRFDLTDPAAPDAVARVGCDGWRFTKWGLRSGPSGDPQVDAARLVCAARRAVAALGERTAFDAVFTWGADLMTAFVDQVDVTTLLWLEDPLTEAESAAYRDRRRFPLAIGERLTVYDDASVLLALGPVALTLDIVGCGGLTRAVGLVAGARAAGIPIYPHGRSLIPGAHLAAAFPDVVPATEYQLQWEPVRQLHYAEPWLPRRGQLTMPTAPGLGIDLRSR